MPSNSPGSLSFQFPPPRGGEPFCDTHTGQLSISIPAPARGRTTASAPGGNAGHYFNSRPREGANWLLCRSMPFRVFQFPPPRGGEHNPASPETGEN